MCKCGQNGLKINLVFQVLFNNLGALADEIAFDTNDAQVLLVSSDFLCFPPRSVELINQFNISGGMAESRYWLISLL